MDHELIGHLYNFEFREFKALETQEQMARYRGKKSPLWYKISNLIISVVQKRINIKEVLNEIKSSNLQSY